MNRVRLISLAVVALAGAAGVALTQNASSVRIFTEPAGLRLTVDGQFVLGAAQYIWPPGSKHYIYSPDEQYNILYNKDRYALKGWETNLGDPVSVSPITAHPDLRYVKAKFEAQYAVTIPLGGGDPSPVGYVYVNGQKVTSTQDIYLSAGSTVTVEAHPNPGYIFVGWTPLPGVTTNTSAFIFTFTLNRPHVVSPRFQVARPVEFAVETSPPGLKVLADRQPLTAPARVEWAWGSVHTIGTFPEQFDENGRLWVFGSWSDGGAINHSITIEPGIIFDPLKITARFVPGTTVTFLTSPPGLRLGVDGRENWPNYTFRWAAGTMHSVAAPAEQIDAQGRKYRFHSWSTGVAASHQFTVPMESDVRVTATFEPVAQISITSSHPGVPVQVDGAECATPCSLDRPIGATIQLQAPQVLPVADGTRHIFEAWSDLAEATRTITATEVPQRMVLLYRTEHRLVTRSNPPDSAAWSLDPPSADGFYTADSPVSFRVQPTPGYKLKGIVGGLNTTDGSGIVALDGPKLLDAILEAVPEIAPAGVRNAAGDTAERAVAPGSIISIFGANLAPHEEVGPANPLAQTIAGVTLEVNGSLLPLISVSPERVNAQLPFDLPPGEHRLHLKTAAKQTVVAFECKRNAPGLFGTPAGDVTIGLFLRSDGSAVTTDNPASPGETLTLIGTGFGPLEPNAPTGFPLSTTQGFRMADAIQLWADDMELQSLVAGPSDLGAGLSSIQFTVPAIASQPGMVSVKTTVGETVSNTVVLPLRGAANETGVSK
jgi:uncharacterized protein (TIGR03437 family)